MGGVGEGGGGFGIGGEFDDRFDGIADHVGLEGRERGQKERGRGLQSYALRRRRRGIHKIKAGAFRGRLSGFEYIDEFGLAANLLQIAESFFLDGGQAARDIAFGRLGFGEIAGLVALDDFLIGVEGAHELVGDLLAGCAAGAHHLGARQFGSFSEASGCAERIEFVNEIAYCWTRSEPRRCIALAAFCGYEEFLDGAKLALFLGSPLDELARLSRRGSDGADIAVLFYRKTRDRFAGFSDAFDDLIGPSRLDADHDAGGHIWIGACSDQSAEVQLEIFSKLEPTIRVRQRQGSFDVLGHRLAVSAGPIVERKNDDVIADAHAAVLPPEPVEIVSPHAYHPLLFSLLPYPY